MTKPLQSEVAKRIKGYVSIVLFGGLIFWGPYILSRWLLKGHILWLVSITFVVPLIVACAYFYMLKKNLFSSKELALFMLLGIWIFGPLGIVLGEIPYEASFDFKSLLSFYAVFPLSTFMLASYNFSLWGLIITTITLLMFALVFKNKSQSQKSSGVK